MNTLVIRIPIVDADSGITLETRITNECDVRHAAGYWLGGSFTVDDQLVLIFQKK